MGPASRKEGRSLLGVLDGTSASGRRSIGNAPNLLGAAWRRSSFSSRITRPRRGGTGAATTGSSLRRRWYSRSLSKSFICIRNASLKGSTHVCGRAACHGLIRRRRGAARSRRSILPGVTRLAEKLSGALVGRLRLKGR
jgi:hypothetical protein